MPDSTQPPWSSLHDLGAATAWCATRPLSRLEAMTPQTLLFLCGHILAQARQLLESHWDPARPGLPDAALAPFQQSIAMSFDSLLLACAHRRQVAVEVLPAPSIQVCVATLARDLDHGHQGAPLPDDLLSSLAEVEAARHELLMAAFSPSVCQRAPAPGPDPLRTPLERLCVSLGRLQATVESGRPCARMPAAPVPENSSD